MPRRTDIESILIIGAGPIVIGQACEFDYSGTQACKVLRAEGYRVILANSNPATIMTDPDFADATYVEPLDVEHLTRIVERESPGAVLPTLGGQTALNLAMGLVEAGVIGRGGTPELIGATAEAIATAEDRERFKAAMEEIGLNVPASGTARSAEEAMETLEQVGLPVVIRPAFILGGKGTGIATTVDEFRHIASAGLKASPIGEILIERSIAGWKEFELEVMRDRVDNCVVVCSIENLDPMGVHTGDSITVAPAQTLTDVEYQAMRDAAFAVMRRVGVETGGSNVQFAIDPQGGDMVVIEMNPRVSRSSALASKATGFPIAKIAARLAVGYTLDEIPNDITRKTPACFEPTIDYVVTKIPRWAFEKLPGTEGVLGTSMQSVGEAMAIGRTFPESLQKALRSLEHGRWGLACDPAEGALDALTDDELVAKAAIATPDRPFHLEAALRRGISPDVLAERTKVDPWFLDQISRIVEERSWLAEAGFAGLERRDWKRAKRLGFSDAQLAWLWGADAAHVRAQRLAAGVRPTFKTVDTCGAEFEASTPYHYSTYEDEDEIASSGREKVIILGSGPNRIGQGIEFDYCCVHASFALAEAGYETVMINCNPETVSTDYDTSDRLYFEPLTLEDALNVIEAEQAAGQLSGVIVALGGQTPLKLAGALPDDLVLGTSPQNIDRAEDREQWNALCAQLEIPQPAGGTATSVDEALAVVNRIGYPALLRPSYVLGGRAMEITYDEAGLRRAMDDLAGFGHPGGLGALGREGGLSAERPVLVDRFLEDATEVDVDAIRDDTDRVLIGGVMEHVEEAGVHSGDSACSIPPYSLAPETVAVIVDYTQRIARALDVRGLLNVQYAVKQGQVFVIEANPRASRTVPFVAKATGVPLVKAAARVMVGATLAELEREGLLPVGPVATARDPSPPGSKRQPPIAAAIGNAGHVAVKEAVLPFSRFPAVDTLLGPEMRSTGEVMGIDRTFGLAFAKSQLAAGEKLPTTGTVFLSLADRDKPAGVRAASGFVELGFEIAATTGTARHLAEAGVPVAQRVAKVAEMEAATGPASTQRADEAGLPTAVDLLAEGKVQLVVNSPRGRGARADGDYIRRAASAHRVPCLTTASAAVAAAEGMRDRSCHEVRVCTLQEYHTDLRAKPNRANTPAGRAPGETSGDESGRR